MVNTKPLSLGSEHFLPEVETGFCQFRFFGKKGLLGQTSIIIVFAVVIILAVVVLFVLQRAFISQPEPSGIGQLKASLEADIERELGAISFDLITKIGNQGGFLDPPSLSTTSSLGYQVPYWQMCQNIHTPSLQDIANSIKRGLERELKLNKDNIANTLEESYGKDIEIADPRDIVVTIRDSDVLIDFFVSSTIDGFGLKQPLRAEVPLGVGRAYNFASGFVEQNSKERVFDRFITSLIYHADPGVLPNSDLLTKCGEFVFKTWDELRVGAESVIGYALNNIVFWQNPPANNEYVKYFVPTVGGQEYPDLDITFEQTEGLTKQTFQSSQSPVSIVNAKPIFKFIPKCLSGYEVLYSLETPMVTHVKSGDFNLNFGVLPRIVDSKIGLCDRIEGYQDPGDVCKDEAYCSANIKVVDSQNKPIPNTKVNFGSCEVGNTDFQGVATGKIPCGVSELNVYNPKYEYYYDILSSTDLDKTVTLKKNPGLFIHFNHVFVWPRANITNILGSQIARLKQTDIVSFSESGQLVYATFRKINPKPWEVKEIFIANIDGTNNTVSRIFVDYLEPSDYEVEININVKTRLQFSYCRGYHWHGGCKGYKHVDEEIPIHGVVRYNITLTEQDTDLYLNAYEPGVANLGEAITEWDYTGQIQELQPCILPVMRSQPQGSCTVPGDNRIISHWVVN